MPPNYKQFMRQPISLKDIEPAHAHTHTHTHTHTANRETYQVAGSLLEHLA